MSEYISPFLFVSIDTMSIESPTSIQENTSSINASKEVEPMLIENPNRFVLFPIQHHDPTYGRCIKRPKQVSGLPKRLILVVIEGILKN